jgi:4-carboxymuconolactone decarboxylase
MPTRQELFQRGEAVRQHLQHGSHSPRRASGTVPGVRQLTAEVAFGAVWARPGLDMRYRMMGTLSVLSVLQRLPQLETYLHSALTMGLQAREIQEIFVQCSIYAGFPTMVNALELAREVFEERGVTVPDVTIPERSLEELETQGRGIRQEILGAYGYAANSTPPAADLFQLALQYGYGEIWQRPGLERKDRLVCAVSAFTALWCEPQLRGFLYGALNVGFSKAEVIEMLIQTAPYGGFPRALNAVALANEIL